MEVNYLQFEDQVKYKTKNIPTVSISSGRNDFVKCLPCPGFDNFVPFSEKVSQKI